MQLAFNSFIDRINKIDFKEGRDLAYLLLSPQLLEIKETDEFIVHGSEEYLIDKILDIQPFLDGRSKNFHRLGKYLESLLYIFFHNSDDYHLITSSLQIQDGKNTKGEIDFILEFIKDKTSIHLEVALKYYLQFDRASFIGPDGKDSLNEKINKLKNLQLKLCSNYRQLLPSKLIDLDLKPQLFIRGLLLFRLQVWEKRKNPNAHNEGWWCRYSEIDLIKDTMVCIVNDKMNWIYPFANLSFPLSPIEFKNQLEMKQKKDMSLMVVRTDKKGMLLDRGFVVSEHWPNQTKSLVS